MDHVTEASNSARRAKPASIYEQFAPAKTDVSIAEIRSWLDFFQLKLPTLVSEAQIARLRRAWNKATTNCPDTRFPIAESREEGAYAFTWAYKDIDAMLSVEVERDGNSTWTLQEHKGAPLRFVDWRADEKELPTVVLSALLRMFGS